MRVGDTSSLAEFPWVTCKDYNQDIIFQILVYTEVFYLDYQEMLWAPKLSPSNIVRLTAKGLLRNIQLLSGCWKNTVVFQAG